MRAMEIIQRQFESDLPGVHLARVRVVFAVARTLVRTGRLSLTSLGRAIADRIAPKHGIKRVDRLLGNPRLHGERLTFYRAIARRVVAHLRPVILIDWTAVTPDLWALVAAVSFEGRAMIVYAETHPIARYLKPHVNAAFLRRLADVLPAGCLPIIVADAAFRSPFMKLVAALGWGCVVRVRSRANVRGLDDRRWIRVPELFERAQYVPTDLGPFEIGERGCHRCRLVSVRNRIHHRRYRCRTRPHGIAAKRERESAHEPWILATSLDVSAAQIVALYARRMQIEETFRDTKSTRFGLSLTQARTKSDSRADVLLLLASIAHLIAIVLGVLAEAAQLHLRFQANTVKNKRVLSFAMLGRLVVASGADVLLEPALTGETWSCFQARASQEAEL